MRIGTTPTHIFILPIHTSVIENAVVTYAQNNIIVVEKGIDDCIMDANTISVQLSQEETLTFNYKENVKIQLRIKTTDGKAYASQIYVDSVRQCLSNEVI